jgi:hypothetical protein
MVLTVSSALSLVTGLVCHHHRHHRQLDASVGASGPHGFAVRKAALSSEAQLTSTASQPYVRDDRETPSVWAGMARDMPVIWVGRESKCFCRQDWTGQIRLIAQQNFVSTRTRREPVAALNASLEHVILIAGASVPIESERRLYFLI